jgi:hypothetical protein
VLNYLDWELSHEQHMIQGVVREFVEREALPLIPDCFEKGEFPRQLIPRLGELGVLGPTIPHYGSGLDYTSYGLICQELERGDSGLRSFVSVQGSLVMFPIASYGSDEQKARYLPGMHSGELIGCFGLTEHEHGSDPASMETRAVRDGDDYILNGGKMWITNGNLADVALIWARITEDGQDTLRGYLVETDTPGFSATEITHKLSLRASVTSELVLQDVRVSASCMLPGVSPGARAVRPTDRRLPAHPEQTRRRPAGHHPGPVAGVSAWPAQGCWPTATGPGEPGQTGQRVDGARGGSEHAQRARRQRHQPRAPHLPPHGQPGIGVHVRRDARDPHAGRGIGHNWS